MQFGILGPVEVVVGGRRLGLGGPKQRTLLAVLLLHANRIVSLDRLMDELWADAPPSTPTAQVHRYISVLRRILDQGAPPDLGRKVILTSPPGYLLRVERGKLDLHEFNQRALDAREERAAGRLHAAAESWRAALALWRGPALGGAAGRLAAAEAARLDELRLAALEERIETDLALGRHADLVGELTAAVAQNPLRDRLRGQLMLAFYRSGRQAEALAVYRSGHELSVEEFGLDPGPELRQLERGILSRDPALSLTRVEKGGHGRSPPARAQVAVPRPLIRTKLLAPAPRPLVSRGALVDRLVADQPRKLTLVCAPAGSGKSSLLADWYAREREHRRFAWLSLDQADNDPTRFWTYLVEALRTLDPALGDVVLDLLRAPGVDMTQVTLPALLNELAMVQDRVVLVLDDYHVVEDTKVHEQLAFLLEYSPPGIELAIATRREPPLSLARLRARGELLEVSAVELRFSEQETGAFLNGLFGLELGKRDVASLCQRTEGWAAGLCIAAQTLRTHADPAAFVQTFGGDDRHITDYLAAEVLDSQPTEVRDFLRRTSILERLCGPLCDTVTGTSGSRRMLDAIERSNLFLVPLDRKGGWYRYHPLLRTALDLELRASEPELVPTLHRRAAAWHLEADWVSEAIGHTVAAGDLADAADLIATHWNEVPDGDAREGLRQSGSYVNETVEISELRVSHIVSVVGRCVNRPFVLGDLRAHDVHVRIR